MLLHIKLYADGRMPLRMEDRLCSNNTAPSLLTDERHMEQEKSVLEITHSISCIAIATDVGVSPESVLHILTNSLGE
jgi:AraC-like DNA-binding protein